MKRAAWKNEERRIGAAPRGLQAALWVTLLIATGLLSACQESAKGPTPQPQVTDVGELDTHAQLATISDSCVVTPGTIYLSKSRGDRVQWQNNARETLFVLFKQTATGLLVPPGRSSTSHRVCAVCDTGKYEYSVVRMVKGVPTPVKGVGPTEPQIGVGD